MAVWARFRHQLARWLIGRFEVPRDAVRWACRRYAQRTALVTASGRWTFRQLHERSLRLAQALLAQGAGAEAVVLCQVSDDHELLEIRLACFECGAVSVCLPDFADAAAVLAVLAVAAPTVVVTSPGLPLAAATLAPGVRRVLTGPDYENWLSSQPAAPATVPVTPQQVAALGLTSGTTGTPKLMATTHGAQVRSLQMLMDNLDLSGPGMVSGPCLPAIPLCGAGSGMMFPALLSGSALVIPPSRAPGVLVDWIESHEVTRLFLTPSQLIDLLELPAAQQRRLAKLRQIIYGTESMPQPKLLEAMERFGPILQQGYGSAEVLPPVSLFSAAEHERARRTGALHLLASSGRVVPDVQLECRGEDGRPVAAGAVGSLWVRSPTRFAGYWGSKGLTPAGQGAWLAMGDVGRVDAQGYLYVMGRQADVIRVQREGAAEANVYPREVEDAAHRHPGVREAALVQVVRGGLPGEVWLVVSLREAVLANAAMAAQDWALALRQHLEPLVPPHARPDRIWVMDALPRSPLGKVLRRQVRDMLHRFQEGAPHGAAVAKSEGDALEPST